MLLPSLVAPFLGLGLAALVLWAIVKLIPHTNTPHSQLKFRRLQLISASFVAFTHGTNDAQKTMGIIVLALLTIHPAKEFSVPLWVIIAAATAMALGTYVGGWRIIHTLGERIIKLRPRDGFAAETATASILWTTAQLGFPVSTTHTIASSIVGAGAVEDRKHINFRVIKQIFLAWVFTLPCAAIVGGLIRLLTELPGGTYINFALLTAIAWTALVTRNWTRESFQQFMALLRPAGVKVSVKKTRRS